MKKIVLLFTVLFSYFSYAQTGDPKVDAMLKELQKAPGKITFMMNGKTMNEVASFVEDAKKRLTNFVTPHTRYNPRCIYKFNSSEQKKQESILLMIIRKRVFCKLIKKHIRLEEQ